MKRNTTINRLREMIGTEIKFLSNGETINGKLLVVRGQALRDGRIVVRTDSGKLVAKNTSGYSKFKLLAK